MSRGLYVFKKKKNPAISSATFADCRVTRLFYFPSLLLSLSPCEIDRLFARSSNRAGRGLRAVLAMHAEAEMLLGKETGERQEVLPTLTVSARDLRARVSEQARKAEEPPNKNDGAHRGIFGRQSEALVRRPSSPLLK